MEKTQELERFLKADLLECNSQTHTSSACLYIKTMEKKHRRFTGFYLLIHHWTVIKLLVWNWKY